MYYALHPSSNYGNLEQRAGLLIQIGRDITNEGKSWFNVELELKGESSKKLYKEISGKGARFQAYEYLLKEGLIKLEDSEKFGSENGTITFVRLNLTRKGEKLYKKLEKEYGSYLNNIRSFFLD